MFNNFLTEALKRPSRIHAFWMTMVSMTLGLCAEMIPADRLVDWKPGVTVGVPGGIPNRTRLIDVTKPPYNADNTGLANAQPAVQAAIDAAASNDVVYLPPGVFRFERPVNLKNFVTLRGSGIGKTTIRYTLDSGAAVNIGSASDYLWNNPAAPNNRILSGLTKGSTNLVVSSANGAWANSKLIQIRQLNDPTVPVIHTYGYENMQKQTARVVAVDRNNLTIWPPLYWTMKTNLSPTFAIGSLTQFAGIEDLSIDASSSRSPTAMITILQAYGCWVKNVRVDFVKNYSFRIAYSTACEMRGCWANQSQDAGSNHAGLLVGDSSALLVEDNIFDDVPPCLELNSTSGSVFAYNFINRSNWGGGLNANHGPHTHHNLYEGNMSPNFQSDGYFGGSSDETLFRNWWHTEQPFSGTNDTVVNTIWAVKLNRFARNFSLVGNVMGTPKTNLTHYGHLSIGKPNIGNENWTGTGPDWKVGLKEDLTVSFSQSGTTITASAPFFAPENVNWWFQDRTSGSTMTITSFISPTRVQVNTSADRTNHTFAIAPGPSGFQELDTNVLATTIFLENHYFPTAPPKSSSLIWPVNQTQNASSMDTTTIPASLYLKSKPTWWGTNRWPAFGPDLDPVVSTIPAQARYFGKSIGAGDGDGTPKPPPPTNIQIQVDTNNP